MLQLMNSMHASGDEFNVCLSCGSVAVAIAIANYCLLGPAEYFYRGGASDILDIARSAAHKFQLG